MADGGGNEEAKIFVGGLSWETNEEKLRNYFSVFGDVTECLVMKNPVTGKSRGFGFVTFLDHNSVKKVLCISNHQLDGRTIDPKECNPRTVAKTRRDYKQFHTSKIFLGGLPPNVTETNLKEFFSKYGNVTEAIIMFDQEKKKSRGFGFLSFDSEDAINKVVAEHYVTIHGKQVEVKRAEPQLAKSGTPAPNGTMPHGPNVPMSFYMQPWNMWMPPMNGMAPGYGWNPTTAAAAAAAIAATAAASQPSNWSYAGYPPPNWTTLQSPFGPAPHVPFGPAAGNSSGSNGPGLTHHHHHGLAGPHNSAAAAVAAAAAAAAAAAQQQQTTTGGFIPPPNSMAAMNHTVPNGSTPSMTPGMMPPTMGATALGNYQPDANSFVGSRPNGPYGQGHYNTHTGGNSNNNGAPPQTMAGWNAPPGPFNNANSMVGSGGGGSGGGGGIVPNPNIGNGNGGIGQGPQGTIVQPPATPSSSSHHNDPLSNTFNQSLQFHGSRTTMLQNAGYHPYRRS